MRENKKDRRYHKIMANKEKRHLDGSEKNELNYEDTQRLFYLFRGKLKPWYKSKNKNDKKENAKIQIVGNKTRGSKFKQWFINVGATIGRFFKKYYSI